MVSLFFVRNFLTGLVTGQEILARVQLTWLPEEVLHSELLLSSFEKHGEALLDLVLSRVDNSAKCDKYASGYDPLVRRMFEASNRIKSKLC